RNAFNVRPYLDSNIVGAASIPSNNNNLVNDGMHVHVASPNSYVASLNSLASQNTFEFYLFLPNDIRIYHVVYTELHIFEIAQLLNDRINLYYNTQTLIQQQIQQQVQLSVGYQNS